MKTVLVIDDDASFRRLMEKGIARSGFKVFSAEDGMSGLRLFNSVQPDVVITDIFMPEMDGLEVINALAKAGQVHKVIALTGKDFDYAKDCLRIAEIMSVAYTFDKPVDIDRLCAAIHDITEQKPWRWDNISMPLPVLPR